MNRGVVIASFGERPYVRQLIQSLRRYGLPVRLYTDEDRGLDAETVVLAPKDILWKGHPRQWVRMTNLVLAKAGGDFDVTCCLNDDMRIVHDFMDGLDLAERFGMAVPLNPRIYVKYNAMGADGGEFVGPAHAPACNVSPMFAARVHPAGRLLLEAYVAELQTTMRGTLALWNASWKTGVTPVYLPETWCVCGDYAEHLRDYTIQLNGERVRVPPIMLHEGHEKVREVFGG